MISYKKITLFLLLFIQIKINLVSATEHVEIYKKNVLHKFVHYDTSTDNFVINAFPNWENETFEVFDKVKDPNGIAIDLGAWIGTTAIWLAKNFYYVIAIDADPISLDCLAKNLNASECFNVAICPNPIAHISQDVIFAPRGNAFNESISYIKDVAIHNSKDNDYIVRSITFWQLIYDYYLSNQKLQSHPIAFIKCDIEGGEESILEELLYFAYCNNIKVYLSFHVSWWKHKKISDFEYLFSFFETDCPNRNICEYIDQKPFASILFEPRETNTPLVPKNIPALIIGYNQFTYIKNMVSQLEKYTSNIIIADNNSTYKPLLDYYEKEYKYTLIKNSINYGHKVYLQNNIQRLLGNLYILTDPDLAFNSHLPDDFLKTFYEVSEHFGAHKVGFALDINADDIRSDVFFYGNSIKEWEQKMWSSPLNYTLNQDLQTFQAIIDTTFCLINKKFPDHLNIRIGGNYTCKHLPWHTDYKDNFLPGEYEAYISGNNSSCWFKDANTSA